MQLVYNFKLKESHWDVKAPGKILQLPKEAILLLFASRLCVLHIFILHSFNRELFAFENIDYAKSLINNICRFYNRVDLFSF